VERLLPNTLAVIRQSAVLLLELLPYVVAGAVVGAALLKYRRALLSFQRLRLPTPALIVVAAIAGSASPLCTIGTVPVVVALLGCGMPLGAGLAFLTASSLINPQMFVLAFGAIGGGLALAQWVSAVCLGSTVGVVAMLCEKRGVAVVNARTEAPGEHHAHHHPTKPVRTLFLDQLEHVLLYVVVGVLLASAINVWLPGPLVARLLGPSRPYAVAAGALLSVPLYVCGGGALPTLSSLMAKGLAPGVVLAFIVAGPATRIQALAALAAVVNKRAMVAYVFLVWLWAFAAGLLFNAIAVHVL